VPKPSELIITASKADANGKRLVVTMFGSRQHRDQFDPDVGYQRRQWREAVIRSLRVEPEIYNATGSAESTEAHLFNAVDDRLYAAVEAADAEASSSLFTPNVVCMADLAPLKTDWLWQDRIPVGCLTIFDGPPGEGKSTATMDLVARLSRGDAMPPQHAPDGTFTPAASLIMSAEDDPQRTIRPRLDAAGADVRKVFLLRTMEFVEGEEEREIQLPLVVAAIGSIVRQQRARLVVIDPLTAHLSEGANANNDVNMRQALMPLARMAEKERCSVVIVRHLNKKEGQSAINRGGGSVGIIGACRAGFLICRDPNDPEQVVLACSKMNLARRPKSLAFSVVDHQDSSRIEWAGEVDLSADQLVSKPNGSSSSSKVEHAKDIISEILFTGPRGSNEVLQACLDAGLSERTYHSARKALGVKSERTGFGGEGQWLLTMNANGFHHEEF
jgi:hypothetical protein